ncbi:hypothetical protein AEB_P1998 [Altererythrobacter sp. B11]|uniref:hypothetical protein n=1 Tax=Altererythrobacter sp. B11 TaxID=2060312 RepID=UPI000DC6E423|nr:hypothetical protein [Altererythrobacter sp. B11]BBC72866.1 hypothetical protein AEB_P1998 [Altererythrobacter sp. B11]
MAYRQTPGSAELSSNSSAGSTCFDNCFSGLLAAYLGYSAKGLKGLKPQKGAIIEREKQ